MNIRRGFAALVISAIGCSSALATSVIFETPQGDFEVELFDEETPQTVANFLNYVERGDYNGSFIHRSDPGFELYGGAYRYPDDRPVALPADPPVVNEPGISNTRGTIAMARAPGNPNSATNQWFFNLADNSEKLDDQDGGFTVFGRVVANGMDVIDAISELPVWDAGAPFTDLPLINYPGSGPVVPEHLVLINVGIKQLIPITAGLNDAWYNTATPGQGFFITVFPDSGKVFLAWFTFDTESPGGNSEPILGDRNHRWLTAFGDFRNGQALLSIEMTQGGVFDSATPMTTQSADGFITIEFTDCNNGLITYDLFSIDRLGEIPIQRIALDNVPACENILANSE